MKPFIPRITKHEVIDRHSFKVTVEAESIVAAGLYIGNFYGQHYNCRYQYTEFSNPDRHVFRCSVAAFDAKPLKRRWFPRIPALQGAS